MDRKKNRREHMEKMPVPKAYGERKRRSITNITLAYVFATFIILLGLLCLIFPEQIHLIFRYMLGCNMVAIGLCKLYRGIKIGEYRNSDTKLTSNGVILVILGLIIMTYKGNVDSIIGSIWGMIGLVKGSEELNLAICHYFSKNHFIGKAIHALIELFLAIMLLAEPEISVKHHLIILGAELIWYGIQLIAECKNNNNLIDCQEG